MAIVKSKYRYDGANVNHCNNFLADPRVAVVSDGGESDDKPAQY